jgi:hypothetical protein
LEWIGAVLATTLAGCAIGQTHLYTYEPPATSPTAKGTVVLFAVRDERADVVAGTEPPTWVGEQRDGWGIPHSVVTTDGRPFAAILQEAVQRDLAGTGLTVVVALEVPPTAAAIAELLRSRGATRALSVGLHDFNVNTYSNMDVEWELSARVFDAMGEVAASDRSQGKETMEAAVRGSIRAAKMQTPPFFYRLVHELVVLNPRIWPALSGAASAEPARKCTVEQILKMKEAGLGDEQVRAACGTTG